MRGALNKVATSHTDHLPARPPAHMTTHPHTAARPHDGKSAHPHGFGCEAPCFVGLLAAAHRADDGRVAGRGEHRIGAECVDGEVDRAWARGFLSDLGPMRTPTGGSESERKGLQKNAGTMSTKRIFTMVMPGKIIA